MGALPLHPSSTRSACPDILPNTAGAILYPQTTQAAAAEAFLAAHRGHVGLITVSIGGNDVTACAAQANLIPCISAAVVGITQNVTSLAKALRAAAGPKVPLIGLTYPDVVLGAYVYPTLPPTPAAVALAQLSVVAFKSLINPALVHAYAAAHGVLVDVTAASGAYTPLTTTTTLAPYGTLPVAVAKVCTLTWYCKEGNIHATTKGYTLIGTRIVCPSTPACTRVNLLRRPPPGHTDHNGAHGEDPQDPPARGNRVRAPRRQWPLGRVLIAPSRRPDLDHEYVDQPRPRASPPRPRHRPSPRQGH